MTETDLDAFLAGERLDDVVLYLAEAAVDDLDPLVERGERTPDGVVLVVPGENGRAAFRTATGQDAMAFAKEAGTVESEISPGLDAAVCPATVDDEVAVDESFDGEHAVRYVFAFAEERNDEVGGLYAEGDVVHAYVRCACGTAYSDRWVAGSRD
ncbi:hypothetical protein BRD17_00980 [Halobacteriales archaeon SW_7_68_16]|nr:MAG: hypothetical protein BRD17_00980 [Halobacteriales archaeon SW_7_68_16]